MSVRMRMCTKARNELRQTEGVGCPPLITVQVGSIPAVCPMKAMSLEQQLERSLHQVRASKAAAARDDLADWLEAAPPPEAKRPKRLGRKKMSNAAITVVEEKRSPLAKVSDDQGVSVDVVVARVEKVREVQRRIMKLGTHYGKVPGTDKDCLLKPGAEILGLTFQLDPEFSNVEHRDGEHLESVVTCTLYHAPTGNRLGSGIGSCSTREKKYAWRNGGAKCPSCGKEGSLLKSKKDPEWFCWRKKDGCGATFPEADQRITSQKVGRVPNPDLADNYNTVRKMACKRAHVAAILFVTCASEIFTQDVEDSDEREQQVGYSPHRGPADDPEATPADGGQLGEEIARKLNNVKDAIARCDSYDKALALRNIIGSRAKQSPLMARRQAGADAGELTPNQQREIDKLWQHCDRQVAKLEKQLATGPEDSIAGDDDGTEALGAPEREPGSDDD